MEGRELDAWIAEKVFDWRWMCFPSVGGDILTGLYPPAAPDRICVANEMDEVWGPSTAAAPRFSNWDLAAWWEDGDFRRGFPRYSEDIGAAWEVVKLMTGRMGYDNPHFDWIGPIFKPEHQYLTQEGYPLGTTCWYVRVEDNGLVHHVCADTPALAICLAARKVYEKELS